MTSELLDIATKKLGSDEIATRLGLHINTVHRWHEMGRVPSHYSNDFQRMLGGKGEATDQFFTKPDIAKKCFDITSQVLIQLQIPAKNYCFIEPSAGCGFFYDLLPKNRRIGIDIDPLTDGIIQKDFLLWTPEINGKEKKYIVIGNPPFGLRGHLALQFINHSANFAHVVAFILPQLFESDGKGVPSKRVSNKFQLAYSKPLPRNSFQRPDGSDIEISTIFQVWTAINRDKIRLKKRKTAKNYIKVFSLSNGGTPASTRNKHMIGKCDVYLPSTCFKGMKAYNNFSDLPNKRGYGIVIYKQKRIIKRILTHHNWRKTAFPSTNGALNLRTSIIEDVVTKHGYYDE